MADLHKEFWKFHDRVALAANRKSMVRTVRDGLRERIRQYFRSTLQIEAPRFRGQGAYARNTSVNPIEGAVGIDDGVFLQHLDRQDDSDWPAAATVQQWIADATGGHSGALPVTHRTCVRVRLAGHHHVDFSVYGELHGQYMQAVKGGAKWRRSDPAALTDWFASYVSQRGEQLRRIVRYLKAWVDFQSRNHGKIADGVMLTVLAAHHFHGHGRDDIALAKTVDAVSDAVGRLFYVLNPVDISEELTACWTDAQKKKFKDAVLEFSIHANGAIAIEDHYKASKLWRGQFGDRFPLGYAPEDLFHTE